MSNGWIKLHRELLNWEWYDDVNTSRLFIHLILTANHRDNNWRGLKVARGSRLTSLDKLSAETNLSVSKIRTAIKKLISTNEIASKSHSQHTVFTIINYDTYQCDDKQIDKPVTNESQTNDKQIATNKNVKNDNNDKEDIKQKRKVKTLLPSNFIITKEMVDWYGSQNFAARMTESTDKWIDAMKAGGYKYVDWQAAWRNGMKKANEWYLQKNGSAIQTKPRAFSQ